MNKNKFKIFNTLIALCSFLLAPDSSAYHECLVDGASLSQVTGSTNTEPLQINLQNFINRNPYNLVGYEAFRMNQFNVFCEEAVRRGFFILTRYDECIERLNDNQSLTPGRMSPIRALLSNNLGRTEARSLSVRELVRAFWMSEASGDLSPIEDLLVSYPDLIKTVDTDGDTALHHAAYTGQAKMVQFLIDHHAPKDAANYGGHIPLHYAAMVGQVEIARLLMNDRNINSVNHLGFTPLHMASMAGSTRVVELLIESGAAVNPVDAFGNTPYAYAFMRGHMEIMNFLVGASQAQNKNYMWQLQTGKTPLGGCFYQTQSDVQRKSEAGLSRLRSGSNEENQIRVPNLPTIDQLESIMNAGGSVYKFFSGLGWF